jgi:DNA-binding transcriptional LysR family regulator
MSLRRLLYFVTVAEELSFTGAAQRLHMAQPPLSTQIRTLEREFDVVLFRRGRRGIALTPAGQALLPEARALLERYDRLAPMARRAGAGTAGLLTIGLVPSAANGRLPAVLRRFREQLPDVDVALVEDRPAELLRRLGSGQVDVVLQYAPPSGTGYGWRVVGGEALVVALPVEHALAARRRVPVSALAGQPLILPPRHAGGGLYEQITRLLAEHGVAPRVVQGDVWLVQTIIGLVAAGVGLAVVPESAAVIRAGEVAYRPLAGRREPLPIVAVWAGPDPPPTVRRFTEQWPAS